MASEEDRDIAVLQNTVQYWIDEALRLREGWSDAEAQIAVLKAAAVDIGAAHLAAQAEVYRLTVELAHRVGWEERALDAEAANATLRAQVIRLERDIEGFYEDERAKRS